MQTIQEGSISQRRNTSGIEVILQKIKFITSGCSDSIVGKNCFINAIWIEKRQLFQHGACFACQFAKGRSPARAESMLIVTPPYVLGINLSRIALVQRWKVLQRKPLLVDKSTDLPEGNSLWLIFRESSTLVCDGSDWTTNFEKASALPLTSSRGWMACPGGTGLKAPVKSR